MEQMTSIDFFVVPTATFQVLFVFVVLSNARRRVLHFQVTEHPSQEWTINAADAGSGFGAWDHPCRFFVCAIAMRSTAGDWVAMTKGLGME